MIVYIGIIHQNPKIMFPDAIFENIISYCVYERVTEYKVSTARTDTKQKFKVKNVKVQYIDNKLFRIEGDITKSKNFIEIRRFATTTICEAFTPEEEQSNDWRRDKTSKIYKQYEMRDKAYTFINDSYQNFKFVKNAYYKVDIRFVYNEYWNGRPTGRYSMIISNIRKQQDDVYVEATTDDIISDNGDKLTPTEYQSFTKSKTDTSNLKRYIDSKFNIDCHIGIRFKATRGYALDSLIFDIKLSESCDKVPIRINTNHELMYDKQIHNLNIFNDPSYVSTFSKRMYINGSPEVTSVLIEMKIEIQEYLKQFRILNKNKRLCNIKLKFIKESSRGENFFTFLIVDNFKAGSDYDYLVKNNYDTGICNDIIRIKGGNSGLKYLSVNKYYDANIKFYKHSPPYMDEKDPYNPTKISEFLDEDD